MRDTHAVAVDAVRRWRGDIVAFAEECCGLTLDAWQRKALIGIQKHTRSVVVGSKGTGKTLVEAVAVWWWLFTRPHANIAMTSVSGDQLRDGLMKELALLQHRSPVLKAAFEWQATRIVSRKSPATWWASARTWSRSADSTQQADTLAGLHADFMMFVLDEAGGIPLAVAVTAEAALASGVECKIIEVGNPTSLDGALYAAAVTQRQHWYVHHVTGDPDDPDRAPRVDRAWAEQQVATYGRDNAWVKVNVLAQFPPASLNALLGVDEVREAMARKLRPEAYSWAQARVGIDVARYGDDVTCLFPRQGLQAFTPVIMRHARDTAVSVEIAAAVMSAKAKFGTEVEALDATGGWAAGAADVLRSNGYSPIDVQFAAPAFDPRFRNRRAELWWAMRTWVQQGGALPNIPELVAELTTPTYLFANGKLQLEEKDQIKKRLGRSPDRADALALTFALPEMPRNLGPRSNIGKAVMERETEEGQWA